MKTNQFFTDSLNYEILKNLDIKKGKDYAHGLDKLEKVLNSKKTNFYKKYFFISVLFNFGMIYTLLKVCNLMQ